MTVALSDISVAPNKEALVAEGRKKAEQFNMLRDRGLLTPQDGKLSSPHSGMMLRTMLVTT